MPAVVGLTQEAAETAVQQANLRRRQGQAQVQRDGPGGVVLSSSKLSGASLKRDSADRPRRVPRTGADQDHELRRQAGGRRPEQALTKAGFEVVIKTEHSDKIAKDLVISQDPKSGRGMKGDHDHPDPSLGPVLVTVPNVTPDGRQSRGEA